MAMTLPNTVELFRKSSHLNLAHLSSLNSHLMEHMQKIPHSIADSILDKLRNKFMDFNCVAAAIN